MIKRFFILLVLLLSTYSVWLAECEFDPNSSNISTSIWDCLSSDDGILVKPTWDLDVSEGSWFRDTLNKWITSIWSILWLLAVFAIAYGWFTLVVSTWDDDKLKKWKDIVKWWILWFLWVVSASFLITALVKIIYSIWG